MRWATTAHSTQVGAELGEDPALGRVADVVAGAADPLQAGGDRLRRLDLEHEVDRAHVDAELEARGGDQARQLARLELVLDHEPLLARQRAVVGAGDRLLRQLVQPQREPLGAAAVVDEDQRRAVLLDQLQQLRVDRRPDRLAGRLVAGALERVELDAGVARLDHRLHGHVDLQVQRLAHAGVDHRARALGADEEAADLLERVLRGRQADPLHVGPGRLGEPLEREREVRAALGLGDGVDLVHDHLLGAVEDLRRLAGEHQVQRLGRGDEDVRRVADHRLALALRRVAGADRRPSRRRRSRAAARAGSSRRRRTAPSAARRRRAACGRRSARPPGGRAPTGTRPASCPSRSARRSACARRWRSPARPAPGPEWVPRRPARTTRGPGV